MKCSISELANVGHDEMENEIESVDWDHLDQAGVRIHEGALSVTMWSIAIDRLTMTQAVDRIRNWVDTRRCDCRFVVTPNVDHIVQLHRRPGLRGIYGQASLTLADGWPLVAISKVLGKTLPERVAGSDLLPRLCLDYQSRQEQLRVFLLGGMPGVPERAAARIKSLWPVVDVVGTCSPPYGFENDGSTCDSICKSINASKADVLVLGLGFPKQELWISEHSNRLCVSTALCVGATIDFLAGEQTRAPRWVQKIKMEWFHRMASDPRRLAGRYAIDAIYFPYLCVREYCDAFADSDR